MAPVRRLTAILAADVAGYSRLMGADEEGTHERLKAHLRELVDLKIGEHRGLIVKNTGDGFLAEFASVIEAVRCAVEVQRGMADRNAGTPPQKRIEFRVGINLGDVIAEEHDVFGDGVNVAARLEALAEPGGICVSRVVRDQVRDKLDFAFEDLGEQHVKNIARPVRVYALQPELRAALPAPRLSTAGSSRRVRAIIGTVAAAALAVSCIAWRFWPAAVSSLGAGKPTTQTIASPTQMPTAPAAAPISEPPVAPRLSIVVLPFANLSNHPDQQYFADGITEDLTTDLSRLAGMFVISRNTAFTYRNKPADAKQVGRELGVRYLLEGSVQRSGNQVRVNAQLIDAETGAHLWAERFDRDIGDLFALQNEVTGRIAIALNIELVAAEAARPTNNPDALDYIFRGRAATLKPPSRNVYAEAVSMYEHALALDPRSAEAKGLMATQLASRVLDGVTDSATTDISRAEELVAQALAASPRSPTAHIAKALVLRVQHRCAEAIPEYETALAINRNAVGVLNILAGCKLFTGAIEEVIPLEKQAIRLSPRDPRIGLFYLRIGTVHLLQSRTDEAIVWLEKARSAVPELPYVHGFLAAAYALKGETECAAAELAEARRLGGEGSWSTIARLRSGSPIEAPTIRALSEASFLAGLRRAGMPEE